MLPRNREDDRTHLDERGKLVLGKGDRKGRALGGLVGISMLVGMLYGTGFWGTCVVGVVAALVFGPIIYKVWPGTPSKR